MGIYVGGTTSVNYLDDYEEGSWTPAVLNASNNPGYSGRSGRYVKVGGMVFLAGYVQMWSGANDGFATFSNTGSYFRIGTLPFTPTQGVGHVGSEAMLEAPLRSCSRGVDVGVAWAGSRRQRPPGSFHHGT